MKRKPIMHEAKQQSTGNEFKKLKNIDRQSESSEDDGVAQEAFIFPCPELDDCDGARKLLQSYLDNEQWDLSGFVDLIVEQNDVGTVAKLHRDDDDRVFSIISALSLEIYKDEKCIKELKEFLLKRCQEKDKIGNLRSLLEDEAQDVCILVSEHVENFPSKHLPNLYDILFDQISEATQNELTEGLQDSFPFDFYILISKVYKPMLSNQIRLFSIIKEEEISYIKPEDEILHNLKHNQLTGIVMAVKADNIRSFLERLHALIDGS